MAWYWYLKNYLSKSNIHVKEKKKLTCSVEDYDRTYDTPMLIFKMIGIRLNKKDSDSAKFLWNLYYWFEFVNIFVAVILEVLHMVVIGKGIFIMMPCIGYAMLSLTNCYKIVSRREVFEDLVKQLRDMYPRGEVSEEEFKVITRSNRTVSYVVKGYYYANALLLVAYMTRPYIAGLQRLLGHDQPREMLLLYYFPFNAYRPVVFEVVTVVQTWQGSVAVLSLQCGVMMFCILLSHIATQFELLSLRVQKLVSVPSDDQLPHYYPLSNNYDKTYNRGVLSTNHEEDRIRQELDKIISRHITLIRLAGTVEDLMSLPLLIIFANSIIIICFCGFCAVIVEKITDVVYKTFLVTALLQVWLVCSYGQRLVETSEGFSKALYKCGWYRMSRRNCKTIFMMMLRSQKAVRVTTYGFQTILCLASYTTVIKTSWSYLSLLLNVYKEK